MDIQVLLSPVCLSAQDYASGSHESLCSVPHFGKDHKRCVSSTHAVEQGTLLQWKKDPNQDTAGVGDDGRSLQEHLPVEYVTFDTLYTTGWMTKRINRVGWTWVGVLHPRTTVCHYKRRRTAASLGDWLHLKW